MQLKCVLQQIHAPPFFVTIIIKGNNICDFLLAFQEDEALPEEDLFQEKSYS